jgi:hypothetical protein
VGAGWDTNYTQGDSVMLNGGGGGFNNIHHHMQGFGGGGWKYGENQIIFMFSNNQNHKKKEVEITLRTIIQKKQNIMFTFNKKIIHIYREYK